MATIGIKLRKSIDISKEGTSYYTIAHKSKLVQCSTKHKLYTNEWNERTKQVIMNEGRIEYLKKVERKIGEDLSLLRYTIRKLDKTLLEYTAADVLSSFKNHSYQYTFRTYTDHLVRKLQEEGKYGTAQNYIKAWTSFHTFLGYEDIPFASIDQPLIIDYERWLMQQGVRRNSASFYMRQLRSIYNKAVEHTYTDQRNPFSRVYTGIDHTRKRAVDKDLIVSLQNLDLQNSLSLDMARDMFLFSLFTRGMAFIDMSFLTKSSIKKNTIRYIRHKTGTPMEVALEPCIRHIIDKYSALTSHDYLLPILTVKDKKEAYKQYQNKLNYQNRLLKQLSQMLQLNEPLTSYVARHTWATLAQHLDIPLDVISVGMGHSSEETTKIYLSSLAASKIDMANRKIISLFEHDDDDKSRSKG